MTGIENLSPFLIRISEKLRYFKEIKLFSLHNYANKKISSKMFNM